ncbi:hypothetical protein MICRO8M_100323 [Microbacterium sp. 8M]|nr:hypothetical protein MICRO8M_100323 [Microbacterium sp. 8M]
MRAAVGVRLVRHRRVHVSGHPEHDHRRALRDRRRDPVGAARGAQPAAHRAIDAARLPRVDADQHALVHRAHGDREGVGRPRRLRGHRRRHRPHQGHAADGAGARRRTADPARRLADRRDHERDPARHAVPLPRHPGQAGRGRADPGAVRHAQHARAHRGDLDHHVRRGVALAVARRGRRDPLGRRCRVPGALLGLPHRARAGHRRGHRERGARDGASGSAREETAAAVDHRRRGAGRPHRGCGAAPAHHRPPRRRERLQHPGGAVDDAARLRAAAPGAGMGMVRPVERRPVPVQQHQLLHERPSRQRPERVLRRPAAGRRRRPAAVQPARRHRPGAVLARRERATLGRVRVGSSRARGAGGGLGVRELHAHRPRLVPARAVRPARRAVAILAGEHRRGADELYAAARSLSPAITGTAPCAADSTEADGILEGGSVRVHPHHRRAPS